jgi:6,7-dimethyl-8-ribityllumazine synthase
VTEEYGDWPLREAAEPPLRAPREPREPERVEPAAVAEAAPQENVEPEKAPESEGESEPTQLVPAAEPKPVPEPEAEPEPTDLASVEHAAGRFLVPDGVSVMEGQLMGGRRSVGIVVSRFNADVTNQLLANAVQALQEAGVSKDAILVMPVPGAFELPLAAMALAKTRRYACIVAIGCVIRGETPHFDFVAGEAASGLQLAAIETGVPIAFGLLTCETKEQAEARVEKGAEAARTALEMADLFARLRATAAAAAAR